MAVGASQHAFGDFCFKAFLTHGGHLGDVDEFVAGMVKVEYDGVVLGDEEVTIGTPPASKFCFQEAVTTGCEVFFQMVNLAVVGCLCFVELGGVVGAAHFTGSHFVKRPT
jgi:hypothetical protein